jgi:hypothetical protein
MDSPDIVEDSEEEETMVKGKAETTINRAARPEDDEGDLLATRLEMLGLRCAPCLLFLWATVPASQTSDRSHPSKQLASPPCPNGEPHLSLRHPRFGCFD